MSWIGALASIGAATFAGCTTLPAEPSSCLVSGCGVHGRCEPRGDTTACVCDPGYVGAMCDACAAGFQDENHNGSCLDTCERVECGPHSRCSITSGRALCTCVAGYTPQAGTCEWTGGPLDPDFTDPQPKGWSVRGNARIDVGDPTDLPGGGVGFARFFGTGEIFQSFEMPAYADAEPLALEILTSCSSNAAAPCSNVRSTVSVMFDGRPLDQPFPFTTELGATKICLGERAFGRMLELGIRTHGYSSTTMPSEADAFVGRVRIVPSPDCAAPGTVKNGDFESGMWKASGLFNLEQGAKGRAAGLNVRCLETGTRSTQTSMTTSVSVPEALEHPALAFWMAGPSDALVTVSLDGTPIGTTAGKGAPETTVLCLPRWSRGFAFTLGVSAEAPNCLDSESRVRVLLLDDFVLTSDPSCGDDSVIVGGFERNALEAWQTVPRELATIVENAAAAHSGSRFLRFPNGCPGQTARIASSLLTAPERAPALTGGPAAKLWYRLPFGGSITARVAVGDDTQSTAFEPRAAWTQKVLCLPRHSWGRPTKLEIELDSTFSCPTLDLDDVTIGVDPSCPSD